MKITSFSECNSIILLHSEFCPSCLIMKQVLSDYINDGIIKSIDINDDKGQKLLKKHGIKEVPAFVINKIPCTFEINTIHESLVELNFNGNSGDDVVDITLEVTD